MASSRSSRTRKAQLDERKRESFLNRLFGEDDAMAEAQRRTRARTSMEQVRISAPRIYLLRMFIFLVLAGFVLLILAPQIIGAFMANPGLNGLIVAVLVFGILLSFRQVWRLFREVNWVNNFRLADPGLAYDRPPNLLAPMAAMLRDRAGRMALTPQVMRSLLESLAMRLDESHDISRYMTGLLVFLGLLGTFWGLLQTIDAVGATIQQLDVGAGDMGVIFEDLKTGLAAPLGGMGTAFSSSLFGLAGSLVLGFLDLQAGQAQNRFYTDVEDWLSTVTDVSMSEEVVRGEGSGDSSVVEARLEQLTRMASASSGGSAASQATTKAMADLAESIQGLVQHVQADRQTMGEILRNQATQQGEMKELIARLNHNLERTNRPSGKS